MNMKLKGNVRGVAVCVWFSMCEYPHSEIGQSSDFIQVKSCDSQPFWKLASV